MTALERPDVPRGTVLRLGADDWRYGTAEPGPLVVRVCRVRWDLVSAQGSDGYVWVNGHELRESDATPLGNVELSVRQTALSRAVAA